MGFRGLAQPAMARRGSALLPCLAVAAAAIVAASVAGPLPAEAISAKFDIFGFGGSGYSDPYAANDADAISPYSQFSNPKVGEKALYDEDVVKQRTAQKKPLWLIPSAASRRSQSSSE